MDLIWGYAGILSLGHGLFFALGGYAFGMYLMRQIGRDGSYGAELPDFMVFLDWKELPWYWAGSDSLLWALFLVVALPGLVAFVFGWFAFRSRIKGVYFSIITQALTYAAMLLFFRNETGFGGNNGFTDFKRILGHDITSPGMRVTLFALSAALLIACLVLGRYLVSSRFGRVLAAIRDAESRVMFIGYNPLHYKLFIWTLSAMLCGLAGALYVPQVGIINPSEMSPANSIEIAVWVAVGGRGTLVGRGARRRHREPRQERVHRLPARILALRARLPVHRRHPLPARRRGRPVAQAARAPRRRAPGRHPQRRHACAGRSRGGPGHAPRHKRHARLRRPPHRHRQGSERMIPTLEIERERTRLDAERENEREHWDGSAADGRVLRPGELDLSHKVILYLDDITVSFDGFRALNKLSLTIDAGELRCIIGPNGAGKTTMMDVITGKTRPDSGTAFFGQTIDLTRLTEPEIAHAGIGRKFQKPTIFEQHTAFENLELAMKADKRVRRTLFASLIDDERDRVAAVLRQIRLDQAADRPAGLLSHGQKQWLEIGMLLMQEPRLLLLDEPVAGMTDDETERTAELFTSLAGKHSLVVVEHDMAFVEALGGKVTVLCEGSVLAEGDLATVQADPRVIEVYLGR
jgi:urea transport system ATP-binding protein